MLTSLTNYLEFLLQTVKPYEIPAEFNYFNKAEVHKLLQNYHIKEPQGKALLYTLWVANNELRSDDTNLKYFKTTRGLISREFEKYFISHSNIKSEEITNNIVMQLQLCLETLAQPLRDAIEAEVSWPNELLNQKSSIITAYVQSYINFVLNQWQENLDYLSFELIERDMNACLLTLLMNENSKQAEPGLQVKDILEGEKSRHILLKGKPKSITLDLSKRVNEELDRNDIARLKENLEANGLSSQSVPVFFKLMGYYIGLSKHATVVQMSKVVYPGDKDYEKPATTKKSANFFFKTKRTKKTSKNDDAIKRRIKS